MTHAEVRKRIDEGIPLTLYVADGRTYEIPHPDFVFLPPRSTVVIVAAPNKEDPDENLTHVIPLLMVSGVTQRTGSVDYH